MTSIYFVRHAHSVYSPDEYGRGLSERGRKDAAKIAERFENEQVDFVVSSPYRRSIETVKGIADKKGLEVQTIETLKERTLADHSIADFDSAIYKVWSDPHVSLPGGESNLQAQNRVMPGVYQLLKKFEGKQIVVGTHGNIMVLILNHFDPQYDFKFWKQLTMPDVYKLTFEQEVLVNVERKV